MPAREARKIDFCLVFFPPNPTGIRICCIPRKNLFSTRSKGENKTAAANKGGNQRRTSRAFLCGARIFYMTKFRWRALSRFGADYPVSRSRVRSRGAVVQAAGTGVAHCGRIIVLVPEF